ncbi:hypothetical protein JHL18_13540 [Clostridium sp. YIM B02505]|uniref:DUF4145 domain-containing protein n=1 Tax=Clostridium yunnanense TaxID=2800325 RepID=A0ABS1EQG0_9CLOT|nr:hypothetical protein [Clostridium yunnanense]MBK1811642.1 hypothetical protein [Clostridium yunnanense]
MFKINYKTILGIIGGVAGATLLGIGIDELIERFSPYDGEGYDKNSLNRQGYNAEGFDKRGFGIDGFDRSGRDRRGYDRAGFDQYGFDHYGYDAEGYSQSGYSRDGFNREGLDRQGYGRDKYNRSGLDRAGHCRQFYSDHLEQLRGRLDDAYQQMQHDKYRYAIYDARVVMEEALKLVVQHSKGQDVIDDKMLVNLKICERKHLLGDDSEFLDRLHGVRHICNANGHELNAEEAMTHSKVYFVIMQIRELLNLAESALACT